MSRKQWREMNTALATLASAWAYLLQNREYREAGNKLRPETEIYDAMMRVIK